MNVDKITNKYIVNEFMFHNIDLNRKFNFINDINEILVLQLEYDQRVFSVGRVE